MRNNIRIFSLIFFITVHAVTAQDWKSLGTDDLFQRARQKAFDGNREEAREMLRFILATSPDYHDVRILLGRTYAWDDNYDQARKELQSVLQRSPQNEDAFNALTDVEMWDEHYEAALAIADKGLSHYPNSEDLLYKRADILNTLHRDEEALLTVHQLLLLNPAHEKGARLLASIKNARMKYAFGLNYSVDLFSRTYDPAHYAAIQLSRTNRWGSSIARLNYAHRFDEDGFQPEVDLYPRIVDGIYAYLNYGYSSSDLFPEHRIGAELFSKLPHSLEFSAGIRYLYFGPETKVTIFTGSLGWYFKSYWLSLRPYITPDEETGTSVSATLFLRRYFEDRDNYIGVSGGAGFTPDDRRIQTSNGLSADQIYILKSQRVGVVWVKTLRPDVVFNVNLDLVNQELSFDEGEYVLISSVSAGIRKKF